MFLSVAVPVVSEVNPEMLSRIVNLEEYCLVPVALALYTGTSANVPVLVSMRSV